MGSDIQPGDVVQCVDARICPVTRVDPLLVDGKVYRVSHARTVTCDRTGYTTHACKVHGQIDGTHWYAAVRFRKIEPGKMEFTNLTARVKEPA